jgi:membrane-bound lytic murein transglycosylase A
VVPYHSRRELEDKTLLAGKSKVIAWVDNRIDLFFLEIQGSGKIALDTGTTINVLYHAKNGRPYRSIGKLLIHQGKIPPSQISMQRIKAYLKSHPEEADDILNHNQSYVFFRQAKEGPFGCYGTLITPGRSLALQKHIFPPAAIVFIDTRKPLLDQSGHIHRWAKLSRLVLNQDTGGAIRGPGRADIYWGSGPYAEVAAGHMKHVGRLFFLVLKPDSNGN